MADQGNFRHAEMRDGFPIRSEEQATTEEGLSIDREFYFQWHITQACNRRCTHCYHSGFSADNDLPFDELLRAADKVTQALLAWDKVGSLSITGGEPFLRRNDVFALIDKLSECDRVARIDILTNGSLLDDDTCRQIVERPVVRRVQLSLEGSTEQTNDRIRGRGAFVETMRAIRRLKHHGALVSVMMTIGKHNLAEVENTVKVLGEEGVDFFVFDRLIPEGQGEGLRNNVLDQEEVRALYTAAYGWSKTRERPRVLVYRPLFCLVAPDDPDVGAMCSAGANALTVLHDGTILPCRRLPLPLGNIVQDGLHDIWYGSPTLWKLRDPGLYGGKCGSCVYLPVCRGCRAMAMAATGDWLSEDPQCWMQ